MNSNLITTLIQGPATIQWKGLTIWTLGDCSVSIGTVNRSLPHPFAGTADLINDLVHAQISFKPIAPMTQPLLNAMFPFFQTPAPVGTSLFSNASSLVITCITGATYTFPSAVISEQPSIRLTLPADKRAPMFGPITFTALPSSGTLWSLGTGSSVFPKMPSNPYADSPAAIFTPQSGSAIGPFSSRAGFLVETKSKLKQLITDTAGLTDLLLETMEVRVSCSPTAPVLIGSATVISPSVIDSLFAIQGSSYLRGGSRSQASGTLALSGLGLHVKLQQVAITQQEFAFGPGSLQRQVTFSQTAPAQLPLANPVTPLTTLSVHPL